MINVGNYFHLYGLLIGLGVWGGIWLSEKMQKRMQKYRRDYAEINIEKLLPVLTIGALIGARAYHVIDYWVYYQNNWMEIFKIWQGGLGIWGAVLGGVLALGLYFKKDLKKVLVALDLLVYGLLLGQIVGRLGNFINHELYGLPTNLPWGIYIGEEYRISGFEKYEKFHPLFAYEIILNLVLLGFLILGVTKKKEIGYRLYVYMIGYGIIRFSLDFLRIDAWQAGILGVSQWISLTVIGLGLWGCVNLKVKSDKK